MATAKGPEPASTQQTQGFIQPLNYDYLKDLGFRLSGEQYLIITNKTSTKGAQESSRQRAKQGRQCGERRASQGLLKTLSLRLWDLQCLSHTDPGATCFF